MTEILSILGTFIAMIIVLVLIVLAFFSALAIVLGIGYGLMSLISFFRNL